MGYYDDLNLKSTEQNAKEIAEFYERTGGYCHNITGTLRKVLLCPPDYYSIKGYANPVAQMTCAADGGDIDHEKAKAQHKELIKTYLDLGIDVELMDPDPNCIYMVFARDFGGCVKEGAIMGSFKEPQRWAETPLWEAKLRELGIPNAARCTAGVVEGGDFAMIDDHTLLFGLFDRTDPIGVQSVGFQLEERGYNIATVRVPTEFMHLDGSVNVIAADVVIMCKEIMPAGFVERFERRGFDIIDFPKEEILSLGANCEGIGGHRVIAAAGMAMNDTLREHGIEVIEVEVDEILRGGGCIHCMTFPLLRERD